MMVNYLIAPFVEILFKQTTSKKIKCKKCRCSVDGENGYIKINLNFRNWKKTDVRVAICMDCWGKFFNGIEKAKLNKTKTYGKLVKLGILKKLK